MGMMLCESWVLEELPPGINVFDVDKIEYAREWKLEIQRRIRQRLIGFAIAEMEMMKNRW
jgi:hypothetical protein